MNETEANNISPSAELYTRVMWDRRIGWKARGLLSYMVMHPHKAPFLLRTLVQCCTDGIAAVRSGLEELHRGGYVSFDGAQAEVCLRTPEGAVYRSERFGLFVVVLVGEICPLQPGEETWIPAMVVQRGVELELVVGNQIETLVPDARLVDRVNPKRRHHGVLRGSWVEAFRDDNEIHVYYLHPELKQGPRMSIDLALPAASVITTH